MSRIPWMVLASFVLGGPAWGQTHKAAATCATLVKQKQHDLAGQCFERLADAIDLGAPVDPIKRKLKGLYLRNASEGFRRHALGLKKLGVRSYYFEKVALLLKKILKGGLCSVKSRCDAMKATLWEVNKKIGYARLTLMLPKTAKIKKYSLELLGYKQKTAIALEGRWSQQLRPGSYTLVANNAGLKVRKLPFQLKPGEQKMLEVASTFPPRPVVEPKKTPVGPFVLGGVGLAAVLGGGGVLAFGLASLHSSTQAHTTLKQLSATAAEKRKKEPGADLKAAVDNSSTVRKDFIFGEERARTVVPLGILGLSLGVALVGAAAIWLVLATAKKPPPKQAALPPSQAAGRPFVLFVTP